MSWILHIKFPHLIHTGKNSYTPHSIFSQQFILKIHTTTNEPTAWRKTVASICMDFISNVPSTCMTFIWSVLPGENPGIKNGQSRFSVAYRDIESTSFTKKTAYRITGEKFLKNLVPTQHIIGWGPSKAVSEDSFEKELCPSSLQGP